MNKQNLNRSDLPKTPPFHEEAVEGTGVGKEICEICGKTFKTHSELDRHMEHAHGNPEKTHTRPHEH